MNIDNARLLIENLLERVELDSSTGKFRLGTISNKEKLALETLLKEGSSGATTSSTPVASVPLPSVDVSRSNPLHSAPAAPEESPNPRVTVNLNLSSLERTKAEDPQ